MVNQTSFKKDNLFKVHFKSLKTSFEDLVNSPIRTIITVVLISVSLAVPMMFYVFYVNALIITNNLNDNSQISLYIRSEITTDQIDALIQKIKLSENIKSVTYISKEQGLAEFSQKSGLIEPLEYLDENPLPNVIEVILNEEISNTKTIAQNMLDEFSSYPEVEQAKFDFMWIQRLEVIAKLLRNLALTMGIVLSLGVVLTVSNTIRINLLAHKDEILIMKIFGATDKFVSRPYIYKGFWLGLIGGFLAWWLNELLIICADTIIERIVELYGGKYQLTQLSLTESVVAFALSIVLSILATEFSLKSILKETNI